MKTNQKSVAGRPGARVARAAPASLSTASPYETLFKTRHRGRGRPDGSVEPLFVAEGVSPVIVSVAKRRAYAVVHEEQRERMAEVFRAELKVLRRRGETQVAADAGVKLVEASGVGSGVGSEFELGA